MPKDRTLTDAEKEAIIDRRNHRSDGDGKVHRNLEVHHKDRDPSNNEPANLRLLTPKEHQELHKRAGR